MPADIKGKRVLITGGGSGIGRAAALEFASLGAEVAVVTGHNAAAGEETVRLIEAAGGRGAYFQCDITKEDQVRDTVAAVVERFGGLDCAFNNAGLGPDGVRIPYGPLTGLTGELWDRVVDVNLKGTFLCLKHELLQMGRQGGGAIVNNASIGGLKMAPNFGAYGPSKAGVVALTRLAALENARAGIRVNVVCPGPTADTGLMANTLSADPGEADNLRRHVIPMGKLGSPLDVARAVVWLCSDMTGHITGQSISVDGGMHIA